MATKYVEFDRKPNFIPKFPKIGFARWSGLSEPTHLQCGPLQRAIVAKWLRSGIHAGKGLTSRTMAAWAICCVHESFRG